MVNRLRDLMEERTMKKLTTLLALIMMAFAPSAMALEAKGVIEEIKICGTGNTGSQRVSRTLQFKVEGKWFATYADYTGYTADRDNNISTSLIMMAYAQSLTVHIKANGPWDSHVNRCGVTSGAIFHEAAGDFIRLAR